LLKKPLKKLLLILLFLPIFGFGQIVNIPDANFKAYLVGNSAINTNGDNEIQVSEASVFNGGISLIAGPGPGVGGGEGLNITDLTGIEAFVSLTYLNCSWNQLTSLDVSTCSALTRLDCYSNLLTSLDVSANTALTYLYCGGNQLTSLDVRNGNNTNFVYFYAVDNPYLYCINVDNPAWSTTNWVNIDSQHYFSNNCSGAGISDINESNTLMIYPNPTNGDFTITGLELVGTVSSLSLTDMNGKVVKVLDTKATKFSMASIKPGVYFLNIISGNKQEVLKIVKE
jgi:hypothetical protein